MTCSQCDSEASTEVTTASGTTCLCGHCVEVFWCCTVQRDELSGALGELG